MKGAAGCCVQWLEADLRGVDRCRTPWLVVGMHRPMYVPYPHKSNRVVGRHLQARADPAVVLPYLQYDIPASAVVSRSSAQRVVSRQSCAV